MSLNGMYPEFRQATGSDAMRPRLFKEHQNLPINKHRTKNCQLK